MARKKALNLKQIHFMYTMRMYKIPMHEIQKKFNLNYSVILKYLQQAARSDLKTLLK